VFHMELFQFSFVQFIVLYFSVQFIVLYFSVQFIVLYFSVQFIVLYFSVQFVLLKFHHEHLPRCAFVHTFIRPTSLHVPLDGCKYSDNIGNSTIFWLSF
jgi:hypothetical protein